MIARKGLLSRVKGERKTRIRRIQRDNTEITKVRRGMYTLRLKVDHQSFTIYESGFYESQKHARWTATQLAIALNRFKFGD